MSSPARAASPRSSASPRHAATQRRRALHAFYKDHEPTWTDAELTEATKRQISLYGGSERQFSELIQKLTTRYGVSPTKTERPARSLSKSRFHRTASPAAAAHGRFGPVSTPRLTPNNSFRMRSRMGTPERSYRSGSRSRASPPQYNQSYELEASLPTTVPQRIQIGGTPAAASQRRVSPAARYEPPRRHHTASPWGDDRRGLGVTTPGAPQQLYMDVDQHHQQQQHHIALSVEEEGGERDSGRAGGVETGDEQQQEEQDWQDVSDRQEQQPPPLPSQQQRHEEVEEERPSEPEAAQSQAESGDNDEHPAHAADAPRSPPDTQLKGTLEQLLARVATLEQLAQQPQPAASTAEDLNTLSERLTELVTAQQAAFDERLRRRDSEFLAQMASLADKFGSMQEHMEQAERRPHAPTPAPAATRVVETAVAAPVMAGDSSAAMTASPSPSPGGGGGLEQLIARLDAQERLIEHCSRALDVSAAMRSHPDVQPALSGASTTDDLRPHEGDGDATVRRLDVSEGQTHAPGTHDSAGSSVPESSTPVGTGRAQQQRYTDATREEEEEQSALASTVSVLQSLPCYRRHTLK